MKFTKQSSIEQEVKLKDRMYYDLCLINMSRYNIQSCLAFNQKLYSRIFQ